MTAEYLIELKVKNVLGKEIAKKIWKYFPKLGQPKFPNNSVSFALEKSRFSNCLNMNLLLECRADENENSTDLFEVPELKVDLKNIKDYSICRAKAYIVEDKFMGLRNWTDWFNTDGSEMSKSSDRVIAGFATLSILLIGVSFSVVIFMKKVNKRNNNLTIRRIIKTLPAHMIFENTENLQDELDFATVQF